MRRFCVGDNHGAFQRLIAVAPSLAEVAHWLTIADGFTSNRIVLVGLTVVFTALGHGRFVNKRVAAAALRWSVVFVADTHMEAELATAPVELVRPAMIRRTLCRAVVDYRGGRAGQDRVSRLCEQCWVVHADRSRLMFFSTIGIK